MEDRLNKWVYVTVEGHARLLAFTYVDPALGPSAKGTAARLPLEPEHARRAVEEPETTLRLSGWGDRLAMRMLTEAEARDLGLPPEPPWLAHFGKRTPWQEDPLLEGKFHPVYPNDIQVLVHAGNPKFSGRSPELVWVRVQERRGESYLGILLNEPQQLPDLHQGNPVQFMAVESGPHPFMVSEDYFEDRKGWVISPCDKCGFTEMFQPPSQRAAAFKKENNVPQGIAIMMMTTFCPLCGGCQMLGKVGTEAEQKVREYAFPELPKIDPLPKVRGFKPFAKKKWWQFWK